jgi:hypothetical protein
MDIIKQVVDWLGLAFLIVAVYKFGGLKTVLDNTALKVVEIYELVSKQDNRIQKLEDGKANKKTVIDLDKRLVKLETEHNMCHKEK